MSDWQLTDSAQQAVLPALLESTFAKLYNDDFADAMMGINHKLKVEVRGWHRKDDWAMGVLLTPWMLTKVYIPLSIPKDLDIPAGWSADERQNAAYVVIGPLMNLMIDGQAHAVHINYHPQLGHYAVQPLVQKMNSYVDNEAAFAAWGEVLTFRKEYRAKLQAEAEQAAQKAAEIDSSKRNLLNKWLKA
jgi:hypothetical protein